MAGKTAVYLSISWPLAPASVNNPVIGRKMDVDNIPAPPKIDNPRAPLSGILSETKPSIVGQKKQTPIANTVAAR